MKDGYRVFDSDLHIIEPLDLWERYVDKEFASFVPHGISRWPGNGALEFQGRPWAQRENTGPKQQYRQTSPEFVARYERWRYFDDRGWTGEVQIEAMDAEGVDLAVLYPTRGLFALADPELDPPLAAAMARAYNNWLYDFMEPDRSRMFGAAMISVFDVNDAVAETRRAVQELDFKAVFLRSSLVHNRNWHDTYYDPLWAEIADLGVAVGFHEAACSQLPNVGQYFKPNDYLLEHVAAHSLEQMLCLISFCGGGVLERHPKLRAFLEGNCSWLPFLLWRMDEHLEWFGSSYDPNLTRMPSEYFKRQCFVSIEADEEPGRFAVEGGYGSNIVFSSDFPHPDSKYPETVERFLKLPLSDEDKKRILWDNCASYYQMGE